MKPFNLEEALAGKPVLLRNGDEAYIRHFESELMVTAESRVVGYSEGGSYCHGVQKDAITIAYRNLTIGI